VRYDRTQVLLLSFTTVSGYEAVEIFNHRISKDMTTGNFAPAELGYLTRNGDLIKSIDPSVSSANTKSIGFS